MNDMQKGITTLLRSAVTGEKLPLPASFSLEEALPFISKQHIVTLVYTGAVNCGIDASEPVMQRLFTEYWRQLLRSEKQMAAVNEIFREFDAANIDYLPLKGVIMKPLYPKPELRWMGDADILIRTSQYDIIRPIMHKLGFEERPETNHELPWKSSGLYVEFHKYMFSTARNRFYAYFENIWNKASQKNGTGFDLKPEDHFLFLFSHLARHYIDGGIGCRYILDLWIFLNAHKEMSAEYIEKELFKLRLLDFYKNILGLIDVWFGNAEPTETTIVITDFIFNGGSWGSWQAHALSKQARDISGEDIIRVRRAYYLLKIAFPNADAIKYSYPILKKYPWLLPLVWPVRWFDTIIFNRKKISLKQKELRYINSSRANAYRDALTSVGLSFDAELAVSIPDNAD